MKKTKLFKSLLVAAGLCVGASAWAAGYTRTLTASLEVSGYKNGTLYDFQNNNPEVLPTSGDLRYRAYENGGYWGLHNFGGGARSATVSIAVSTGNLLVLQDYSSTYPTTVNVGTLDEALSSSTGYRCFNITSDVTTITLSCPRYGGVVAALLMEKDASVETADYTINYVCNSETVKTTTGNTTVGSSVNTEASFFANGVKYIRDNGEAESVTIAATGNTFTVNVHQAPKYTYTLNAVDGDNNLLKVLGTGEQYEGENATVYFNKAFFLNGKWYITDAVGNWVFHKDYTSADIVFTEDASISYFIEVEDINTSHSWAATGDYANLYSNGKVGRLYKDSYAYTDALEGGIYTVTLWGRNHAGSTTANVAVYVRDSEGNETKCHNQFEEWGNGAQGAKSIMIEIPDGYSLELKNENADYNSNLEMDYLILRKSGINTMSIVGFTPESGLNDADKWNPANGIAMTRDADDPSVWTAVVENYIIRGSGSELKYYYKAAANGTFDGYQLPASGNQNFDFNYSEAGEGKYKLTFTANTFTNEVSLAIEKQITGTIYYVNTWDWSTVSAWVWNDSKNFTGGNWPGQGMTKTEDQIDGHDVYVWSTYDIDTPTSVIFNDGSSNNQTGTLTYENGATYGYYGASTVSKTITAAGYATYCSENALDFTGTGLTAYIAKKDEQNASKIIFVSVTKVPANTGLLLKGDAGNHTINTTTSNELDDVTNNVLKGVTKAESKEAGIFVLMNGSKGVGFYMTTKTFTVGANTAYIPSLNELAGGGGEVRFIGFNFDGETTGVDGIATVQQNNGEVYNLQGQRVSAAKKGLYIINGKKVLVK